MSLLGDNELINSLATDEVIWQRGNVNVSMNSSIYPNEIQKLSVTTVCLESIYFKLQPFPGGQSIKSKYMYMKYLPLTHCDLVTPYEMDLRYHWFN